MAIHKIVKDEKGIQTEYHRIREIEVDYTRNQYHVYIESYTNEEYRMLEKIEAKNIELEKEKTIKSIDILEDEKESIIKNLEARQITPKSLKVSKYTLELEDLMREKIYTEIIKIIPEFKEANKV